MDEPLFNELLESVKQADQIMTDHAELRRLAKAATPGPWVTDAQKNGAIFNIESESGDMCIAMSQENPAPTRLEINEQRRANAEWIAAANPKAILALLDQIDGLSEELSACTEHPGGCGYWREAAKRRAEERDRLRAQNDALRGALHAVQAEVDGNLRPLTRDLVNMVSGLNNGTHPNDIYDHCDEIERIIDAALEGATQ
ncbi:ead/Ea22-like family protein [Pseudomonas aeruginosa]|uniref:ead/Ea22-like family protein n=1 Tax=Pseudomonas aeruginosa TaxID=287 RepID=UPI000664F1E8|nr:ead/Ea22-like family protein [Pseudomonas aeruginosa]EKT8669369.1 ead/Ea22-like family protein [Pseudomonas aeruginosa]MCU8948563.1 ead/Ea22-like family protein [Pseudomonas aeruginosa]HCF5333087.1 ead/Ea22-like family protein [Pseudomonas aeruginosa]HCF5409720.1 ead/Ea22-like family protein [Pseudomonas aeruginosa]